MTSHNDLSYFENIDEAIICFESATTEELYSFLVGEDEIKKQIAEQNPVSREEVEKIVSEQLSNLKIELSEKDRQLLVDLMDRIRQLDIDFSKWSDQLNDLSNTIEEKLKELKDNEGFWQSVKNFFTNLIDSIRSIFN